MRKISSIRYLKIQLVKSTRVIHLIALCMCIAFIIYLKLNYELKIKGIRLRSGILGHSHTANAQHKIDWHDWNTIQKDEMRRGLGEHGEPAHLLSYPIESKEINDTFGYNGYLSEKISLNRSLNDLRPKECIKEKYSSHLPSVSVIIIFFNEHFHTLLRTCASVINRSPAKLLNEVILVDDGSTIKDLGDKLDKYVRQYMPIVKILRTTKRQGLIKAKTEGAKVAKSEVLVFLDSHCEAYHNWLPPLLDPISRDYRTVVCPTIDMIQQDTFRYSSQPHLAGYGSRGSFDWNFNYKLLKLLPTSLLRPSKPFENPIMAGGLFAITAKFFWELGAYDNGLEIYGGEQYELSFKIWLCGGRMLDTACSRVGHIYRQRKKNINAHISYDYYHRNHKRVAEVWMDEYKELIYDRHPDMYYSIDAGDLTEQHALRKRLKCKPFKYFIEKVAFDLMERYPPYEPAFVYGAIQNLGMKHLCVDTFGKFDSESPLHLFNCAQNVSAPQENQFFGLTLEHELRHRFQDRCWTANRNNTVQLEPCSLHRTDNKIWKYDLINQWIVNKNTSLCLDIENNKRELILNKCDKHNDEMKWQFGSINHTAFKITRDYNRWD